MASEAIELVDGGTVVGLPVRVLYDPSPGVTTKGKTLTEYDVVEAHVIDGEINLVVTDRR